MSITRKWTNAVTNDSAANTAKTTTITKPTGKEIYIHTLTVSTGGADLAADCSIVINDNAVAVWKVEFRAGQIFGGHFDFSSCPIPVRSGDATIVVDAGGASVVTTTSVTYEIL